MKNKYDMAESEIFPENQGAGLAAMKEALNAQQQLLHKLYAELDQEREASETAASEALSMILRLQVEKAAVEMEAKQYKRIAEEKMFHANECLAICENVIYRKDMEIAALECQIQAYKYKILSLGCYDIDCAETKSLESTFLQKIESVHGQGNSKDEEVNMNTCRPLVSEEKARADSIPCTENGTLLEETKSIAADQELKAESADTQDIGGSYWQQIKQLDERVKGILNTKDFGGNNRSNSMGSLSSRRSINALSSCLSAVKKQPEVLQESKTIDNSVLSTSVQDIFEVPEVSVSHADIAGKRKVDPEKEIVGGEIRLIKPDSSTVIKSLSKPEPITCVDSSLENKLFKSSVRKNLDHCNFACVQAETSNAESRSEIKQLSMRIAQLETATNGASSWPEITVVGEDKVGLLRELLKKIQTQLSEIQTDIKSLKRPKPKKRDDSALRTIQEDMLHFWL